MRWGETIDTAVNPVAIYINFQRLSKFMFDKKQDKTNKKKHTL